MWKWYLNLSFWKRGFASTMAVALITMVIFGILSQSFAGAMFGLVGGIICGFSSYLYAWRGRCN